MSEPENFLARWSRRKQEAESAGQVPDEPPREQERREGDQASTPTLEGSPVDAESADKKEPAVDLSALPPIDSIGAGTDIRAFLQKGVPLELSRAALRRAWVSDPAIRDFIEVAENQWDFATGSDLPGFGPLDASDDVRRLVAEVFQERLSVSNDAALPNVTETSKQPDSETTKLPAVSEERRSQILSETSLPEATPVVQREDDAALQQGPQGPSEEQPLKRTHGRALPQ